MSRGELCDFLLPPGLAAPEAEVAFAGPTGYRAARWRAADLAAVAAALGRAAAALAEIPQEALLAAWSATVEALLDPGSAERRELLPPLAALCGLTEPALDAGLAAVLGGVRRDAAAALFARAATTQAPAVAAVSEVAAAPARPGAVAQRSVDGQELDGGDAGRECYGEPREHGVESGRSGRHASPRRGGSSPVLVVLASNLPGLAVQALLPALARRRPVLLKSPSAEPLFAPAFLAALVRREPRLAPAVAAAAWPGGDATLEAPLLRGPHAVGTVVAYGGEAALRDLGRRAAGTLVGYGPKTSLAILDMGAFGDSLPGAGSTADGTSPEAAQTSAPSKNAASSASPAPSLSAAPSTTAATSAHKANAAASASAMNGQGAESALAAVVEGLARDVALFDQRGCLSVAEIYIEGGMAAAERLAELLAAALARLAVVWPPGPASPAALAAVQQERLLAELCGRPAAAGLAVPAGTVLIEPEPGFRPTPGLRMVRIHPLARLDALPEILASWRGQLQGAALAGPGAWHLVPRLIGLGFSRFAAPGELQSPDLTWHNGGIDPLEALGES